MDVLRSSTDISLNLSARNDDEARQTSELHKLVTPPPLSPHLTGPCSAGHWSLLSSLAAHL